MGTFPPADLPVPKTLLWTGRRLSASFPRALRVLLVVVHADKVLRFCASSSCIQIQRVQTVHVCVGALLSDDLCLVIWTETHLRWKVSGPAGCCWSSWAGCRWCRAHAAGCTLSLWPPSSGQTERCTCSCLSGPPAGTLERPHNNERKEYAVFWDAAALLLSHAELTVFLIFNVPAATRNSIIPKLFKAVCLGGLSVV